MIWFQTLPRQISSMFVWTSHCVLEESLDAWSKGYLTSRSPEQRRTASLRCPPRGTLLDLPCFLFVRVISGKSHRKALCPENSYPRPLRQFWKRGHGPCNGVVLLPTVSLFFSRNPENLA